MVLNHQRPVGFANFFVRRRWRHSERGIMRHCPHRLTPRPIYKLQFDLSFDRGPAICALSSTIRAGKQAPSGTYRLQSAARGRYLQNNAGSLFEPEVRGVRGYPVKYGEVSSMDPQPHVVLLGRSTRCRQCRPGRRCLRGLGDLSADRAGFAAA